LLKLNGEKSFLNFGPAEFSIFVKEFYRENIKFKNP